MTTTLGEFAKSSAQSSLASLTKGGRSSVTTSLVIEDAGRCICVNAVSLGVIHTPLHPVERHGVFPGWHPVARIGTIDNVTRGVLYLEEAPFVTGEILHIDGGQIAES
jgi:NAD(P)-dependent dehydrogenase (short-subunit alcohol dehydrogenase family)